MIFTRTNALKGEITVPGDKSISHRSIMFGALADGTTRVTNFLRGADCLSTIDCFRKLGIDIEDLDSEILIHGKGLHGLTAPSSMLDVGKQWHYHLVDLRHSGRSEVYHRVKWR